jgi:prevent-host-death family protein
MYIEEPSTKVRNGFCARLDRVRASGGRILITRNGREMAALVSVADLRALERVEQNREEFMEARHHARMREFRALKEGLG